MAEELVGDIDDEHDGADRDEPVTELADGWVMTGDLPVDEAERLLGVTLPTGDYETVAGMVIAHADGLPAVGDRVSVPLPPEPSDFLSTQPPGERALVAEIRAVQRRVPAHVHLSVAVTDARSRAEHDV